MVWKPAATAVLSAYYVMRLFEAAGLRTGSLERFAFLEGYLGRFPGLGAVARAWDRRTTRSGKTDSQGQVCAVFRREVASEG